MSLYESLGFFIQSDLGEQKGRPVYFFSLVGLGLCVDHMVKNIGIYMVFSC
jgi:hypothetical protein